MTGQQIGILRDIINQSFNETSFVQFLKIRLNKDLFGYTQKEAFPFMVFNLIQGAKMEGWTTELIEALQLERPKNKELLRLSMDLTTIGDVFYKEDPGQPITLQRIVNEGPLIEPEIFLAGLSHSRKCICRIEIMDEYGKMSYGTGFLVGPDKVLSNYHVFEKVIKNPELSTKVICRFDYSYRADGSLNPGTEIKLAKELITCYSVYSDLDLHPPADINGAWPEDKCDYALVKLEKEIGNEPFGVNAELVVATDFNKRGWINSINKDIAALRTRGNIVILQHPKALPLKIAFGMNGILGSDASNCRVRYAVNTEPGSSGAPCFDENFNWIALHNMGDPDWNPKYNQGVTAINVVSDLKKKGVNNLDICK